MTEMSTWVVYCHFLSDADCDIDWPTSGMIEVRASSRCEALAAVRRKLGDRLLRITDSVTEWPPGAFGAYVDRVCKRSA